LLIKIKTLTHSGTRVDNSRGTTRIPAKIKQALGRGLSAFTEHSRAIDNGLQFRFPYSPMAFRSKLRKDFQSAFLPRLTPTPGSLSERSKFTRFHHRFYFLMMAWIMP